LYLTDENIITSSVPYPFAVHELQPLASGGGRPEDHSLLQHLTVNDSHLAYSFFAYLLLTDSVQEIAAPNHVLINLTKPALLFYSI
jgi:hypothetical protein